MKITCPHCAAAFNIKSQSAFGKKVKCPKCATPFVIQKPAPKKPASRKQPSSTSGRNEDAFFEEEDDDPIFLEDDSADWEDDGYEIPEKPSKSPRRHSAGHRPAQPNFLSALQQQGKLPYLVIPAVGLLLLILIVVGLRMLPGKRGLGPARKMELTSLKEFNLRTHQPLPLQWAAPGKAGDNVFQEIQTASIGKVFEVTSIPEPGRKYAPASQMKFRVFLPPGANQSKRVPCVIVPPAGSTLLTGMSIDDVKDIPNPEHEPYLKAGFAVLTFSIDGDLGESDQASNAEFIKAHHAFRYSRAGLFNYAQALSQALYTVPEIDSEQIFIAGHSSAATLSLLFAEHYQQYFQNPGVIKGCLAYAPSVDPRKFFADHLAEIKPLIPDVEQFIELSSPREHYQKLGCPVFLFHSQGDQVTSFQATKQFAGLLKNKGVDVKFVASNGSDHYQTMLDEGIPQGIQWIQSKIGQAEQKQNASQPANQRRVAEMKKSAQEHAERVKMKKLGINPDNRLLSSPNQLKEKKHRPRRTFLDETNQATFKIDSFDRDFDRALNNNISFKLDELEIQMTNALKPLFSPNHVGNVIINRYHMTVSFDYTGTLPANLREKMAENEFTRVLHLSDDPPTTQRITEDTVYQENDFDIITFEITHIFESNFNPLGAKRTLEKKLREIEEYIPNSVVINYDDKWAFIKVRPTNHKFGIKVSAAIDFSNVDISVKEKRMQLTPEQMALGTGPDNSTPESMSGTESSTQTPAASAKQKYIIHYGLYGGDDIQNSARRCLKGFVWVEQDSVHFNPDRKEITFENRSPVDQGALERALKRNHFFQLKITREAVPQTTTDTEPVPAATGTE